MNQNYELFQYFVQGIIRCEEKGNVPLNIMEPIDF